MSTHRRAWKQRAGVVVALVAGALLTVPATPAFADTKVSNVSASPGSVEAGKTTKVTYTLRFDPTNPVPANVSVSSDNSKLTCIEGCNRGNVTESGSYDATFKAADNATNGSATITVRASEGPLGGDQGSTNVTLVAKAAPTPSETQTVKTISGKVTVAANGDAVPNAVVMLRDSQGHQYQTTSDGSGNYRFSGSSSQPISPGRIDLGASKDNIVATRTINASAGQSLTGQRIALALKVEVSPSATPSATEEPLPTDEATDEATEETAEATAQAQAAANEDGGGAGSFIIILLGGLLVAAGVGTIVLLWMRRKNADEEDDDAPAGAAAAGAVPGARGAFRGADDQTRVVNRVGAAGPDPTMIGGTSLSDAPTMMHRPVVDDVPPDPYGAPPQPYGAAGVAAGGWAGSGYGDEPAQGGYGQQNGYGNAPSSGGGYGNAPASGGGYGAPSADAGYGAAGAAGAAAGGYGNAPASGGGYGSRDYSAPAGSPGYAGQDQGGGYGERYDEPTGRYTGESTGAYAPAADPYPTSTYQPDQGHGYGQPDPAPYGRGQEPAGGNGYGNGYGGPGGGYDAGGQQPGYDNGYGAAQGGYEQPAGGYGAGQGGYDQQGGGYEQPAGGYGAGQGGYGQQGGYDQEPPQQRTGGYDDRGYDQQQGGGYYGDQAQAGRGRPDAAPQQDRGGRRLDWLDD
ncbi:carboxypeptidase-like regulatory domain-containing protein [Micromonospora sp. L32]|uniref:carboxypeptidase-like regulatory domain-containing protein n=1 Tax=Micromonospora sp. L32 TaxID=3452214 RepID=UPI003F8C8818